MKCSECDGTGWTPSGRFVCPHCQDGTAPEPKPLPADLRESLARVVNRHAADLATLYASADCDTPRAESERDALRAEVARLTAERDALRARLDAVRASLSETASFGGSRTADRIRRHIGAALEANDE